MNHDRLLLSRTNSCNSTTTIIPSNDISSTYFIPDPPSSTGDKPLFGRGSSVGYGCYIPIFNISIFLWSILNIVSTAAIIRWINLPTQLSLTSSLSRKVTDTLFGFEPSISSSKISPSSLPRVQ
ncbi:unnamed protein product [Lactuca virosa]|uniref:Uncharacterized protein n=1 Tax=Lactuca virosa TaxID=75947 RepID=A0AAU9P3T5_9ASTR|nr:unnamed protein product [Lactuca virosa]